MAATLKRQRLKKLIVEDHGKTSMRKLMLRAGYSLSVANSPSQIIDAKDFQKFLSSLDDTQIVKRWHNWALNDTDKRVALESGKEILKLKQRYPEHNLKIGLYREEQRKYIDGDPEG